MLRAVRAPPPSPTRTRVASQSTQLRMTAPAITVPDGSKGVAPSRVMDGVTDSDADAVPWETDEARAARVRRRRRRRLLDNNSLSDTPYSTSSPRSPMSAPVAQRPASATSLRFSTKRITSSSIRSVSTAGCSKQTPTDFGDRSLNPSAGRCSSTVHFSPYASYTRLDWSQAQTPSSLSPSVEAMPSPAWAELGSFTTADDGMGRGKVDMAVQVDSPFLRSRAGLAARRSQVETKALSGDMSVDDEMVSRDAQYDRRSAALSLHSALSGSPSHRYAPSPLDRDRQIDLFSPPATTSMFRSPSSSPSLSSRIRLIPRRLQSSLPPLSDNRALSSPGQVSTRALSSSARPSQAMTKDDWADMYAAIAPGTPREVLSVSEDDSIEIVEMPSVPARHIGDKTASTDKENAAAKLATRQVLELDSDGDIEIVSPPPPPPPQKTIVKRPLASTQPKSSSSGWFTRPPGLKSPPSASGPPVKAAAVKRAPKEGSKGHKRLLNGERKKAADAALRERYKLDFRFDRWGSHKPKLLYTANEAEVDRAIASLSGELGFDLEWEPSTRQGKENKTALVQVCDKETIILVHVARMKRFPQSLRALIEDPERIKLGVQIAGDARKLVRDFEHTPRGLLELNNVAKLVDSERYEGKTGLTGLQQLCATYLDRFLSKDSKVRQGKWSSALDKDQIYYAANDVFSSLHIFLALRDLAEPEHNISALASDNVSTASSWRPPLKPTTQQQLPGHATPFAATSRKQTPTPRQLETYRLWHDEQQSIDELALRMNIKPTSVVWNLLACLGTEEGRRFDFSDQRLADALGEVSGGPEKMRYEGREVIAEMTARLDRKKAAGVHD